MKKRFTALLLMLAILIIPAAAASTYRQQIAVEYGITLNINGQSAVLKDPNGNTVQPFVYNGTTYVPIRAVSDNLGATVEYDATTKTASIIQPGEAEWVILREDVEILDLLRKMHNLASAYMTFGNSCMSIRQSITQGVSYSNLIPSTQSLLSDCQTAASNARNTAASLAEFMPENMYKNICNNLDTYDRLANTGTLCLQILLSSASAPYDENLFNKFADAYTDLLNTASYVGSNCKSDYDIWYGIILGE